MLIEKLILGAISLATLIWAFFTLPQDDDSEDEGGNGGTNAGGDSSPSDTPPVLANKPSKDPSRQSMEDAAGSTSQAAG